MATYTCIGSSGKTSSDATTSSCGNQKPKRVSGAESLHVQLLRTVIVLPIIVGIGGFLVLFVAPPVIMLLVTLIVFLLEMLFMGEANISKGCLDYIINYIVWVWTF